MNRSKALQLEPLDFIGRSRIETALARLKRWDGKTWAVTDLPAPTDRMHVRPATDECVDWLCFWIELSNDEHVRVVE